MRVVSDLVRRLGAADAALFVLDRVLDKMSGGRFRLTKHYFTAQPVPQEPMRLARASGITVDELHEGDPRLALLDRPAAELARRFASGARCFAAWQGETLAGFLWYTGEPYVEEEIGCTFRVHPADRAVWDLDVHVVPRFRLGRTFALLWAHAFAAMRADAIRWTISRVSAFNADSIRAHQRLGAQRTGWVAFFSLGSFRVTLTSLGILKCGRQEHGSYPVIEVRAPTNEEVRSANENRDEPALVAGSDRTTGRVV